MRNKDSNSANNLALLLDKSSFGSKIDGQKSRYPLIDANMKDLSTTGFMSNRVGRLYVPFLFVIWELTSAWEPSGFETYLLDYDPCSNYINWTYGAGVGNDPREDFYVSISKQSQTYDPEGEYVSRWLPQLRSLPKERKNFLGKSYIDQVMTLKFGSCPRIRIRALLPEIQILELEEINFE